MFGFGRRAENQNKGAGKIGGLFGLAMFVGAAAGLAFNESRTVNQAAAIAELSANAVVVEIDPIKPENDGKAVYFKGALETEAGVQDDYFTFGGDDLLVFERKVEMYQWVKHRRDKKDVWEKEWSEDAESDGGGHSNPGFPVSSATFSASDAHVGAFHLAESQLAELDASANFDLPGELPQNLQELGWSASGGNRLYLGANPNSPSIGDVRAEFTGVKETTVSAMGRQTGNDLVRFMAKNGYDVFFIEPGEVAPELLVQHGESANSTLAYVLRAAAGAGMALGLGIAFSGFVGWLTWIPLLGPMIGRFAFWLGSLIGAILAAILFVGAWLWMHPLALVATIAVISLAFIAYGIKSRNQPSAASAGMPPPIGSSMPPPPPGFAGPPPPPPPC